MKKISIKVLIFVTFVFMGFFIVSNINIDSFPSIFKMKAVEYKKILEERNRLYKEVDAIKEENKLYSEKISKYQGHDGKSEQIVEDLKAQLKDYSMITGVQSQKGPGLIIKIEDGNINTSADSPFEIWRKILHDNDMALVLNEIRNAGAEATAINGHRIINSTGVRCRWAFIGFENQTMEYAPFYIYVIGDPEQMKTTLLSEGSHIQQLRLRSLKVEIKTMDEIVIPKTAQNLEVKYMQRYFSEEK